MRLGVALARTALAGNPSDGYGGAVLAMTLQNFRARVEVTRAEAAVHPQSVLISATVLRFARTFEPAAVHTAVRWRQSIPRELGLGSSSGLVIATLRALADLYGVSLTTEQLAACAIAVEREDLGIAGGYQDQVVQSHGGLLLMDFGEGIRTERLDPGLLPPLLIAFRTDEAQESGAAHADLRARSQASDAVVAAAMKELSEVARGARDALLAGDRTAFAGCVDRTLELRKRVMSLRPAHLQMVQAARACGASANYCGSGGAIVCVCADERQRHECADALAAGGCTTAVPQPG